MDFCTARPTWLTVALTSCWNEHKARVMGQEPDSHQDEIDEMTQK